ncbi:MAG: BMP family ABC transporter substrate-binding protein [Actinobacteria bacterium]|jgi:basic membrane lipoprotein Med (substrate-binding protein (PBP1-ABC) superfamily)|nr:BMP family ABC transporter substrate-binding protein [Actinomycetota bacterium]
MKFKALFLALVLTLSSMKFAYSEEFQPKVAVAYDIGFLGDNSFNDAVNGALSIAKKKYNLVEPFIREVPTNGTAVDRLTRLRFLARSGYALIITVGPSYRETVRRVSMEFPEIQFAIINDRTLGQLNISNIYFNENDGAYLAGVLAATSTKRRVVGFVGSEPELLASFTRGVKDTTSRVKVVNIPFPDEISALRKALARVDIVYSTWDGDASVLTTIMENFIGRVQLISESPDQFFASLPSAKKVILGKVEKNLVKPIDQLIGAALSNRAIIDVLDEANGIYGREYGALNGGVKITFSSSPSTQLRFNISKALSALRKG